MSRAEIHLQAMEQLRSSVHLGCGAICDQAPVLITKPSSVSQRSGWEQALGTAQPGSNELWPGVHTRKNLGLWKPPRGGVLGDLMQQWALLLVET